VSQEFSQGNIQFSANSLDLAITGDGFFPLKSADGLQDIYTRNGTFVLDDSFSVVNSAGQGLMAASVDSSGKADLNDLKKLIIPRATVGDAVETSLIELGLNVPADARVITSEFNRNDPSTYSLTTAVTVFDQGGNEYLATVFYAKTQVASPDNPFNKWQTHVFIGETKLEELLIQASDNDEKLYVNKYGEIRQESKINPAEINGGVSKLFNLDDLNNPQQSEPATVGGLQLSPQLNNAWKNGLSPFEFLAANNAQTNPLKFDLRVDASASPVTVDLGYLLAGDIDPTKRYTGVEIAREITNAIAKAYGDERHFNFSSLSTAGVAEKQVITPNLVPNQPYTLKVGTTTITTANLSATPTLGELVEKIQQSANYDGDEFTVSVGTGVDANKLVINWENEGDVPEVAVLTGPAASAQDGVTTRVATGDANTAEVQSLKPKALTAGATYTLNFDGVTLTTAPLGNSPTLADLAAALQADSTYNAGAFTVAVGGANNDQLLISKAVDGVVAGLATLTTNSAQLGTTNVADGSQTTPASLFEIAFVDRGANPETADFKLIDITETDLALYETTFARLKPADAAAIIQTKLINETGDTTIKVAYDPVLKSFTFKTNEPSKDFVLKSVSGTNQVFNLSTSGTRVDPVTGAYPAEMIPLGDFILPQTDQRFGIKVTFDDADGVRQFKISSGTTGDTSSVEISNASDNARALFGFPTSIDGPLAESISPTPLRGITSSPAILSGNPIGINVGNKFRVDGSNNQFVVTVDNVTGVVTMPPKADYTIEEFREGLELRINALADSFGRTVNGVKVDVQRNALGQSFFNFTTGTTGNDAFLKVSANSIWGLADLDSARGTTSRWVEPPQARNAAGFPLYVNRDGLETSDPGDFNENETANLWSPIFLDNGELTFNTNGNLRSPGEAIRFKASTIGETGATLQFAINYAGSTQFSSPFSVLAQNQNGRPEGDLIGLNIGDDGLVSANYSNGTQKNLAKIVLANFTAPTGLRQLGDSSYLATSQSGRVTLGEAGAAGFGTVRAGATERANVDLTQELIELITAQRNFQANAKAIETNNTLTQAIINIRS
jgi:flagellar hook-basal body protein